MPVGFAILAAEKLMSNTDESIVLSLSYRSFPAEELYRVLKVSQRLGSC